MAALVPDFKLVADRDFLACLDGITQRLSSFQRHAAALVERKVRIDQITMIGEKPIDAHSIGIEDFFVRFQGDDDVSIGLKSLLLVPDKGGDKGRSHELVVGCSPAIKVTVLLHKLERIGRPILPLGWNNVEMSEQQDRFTGAAATKSGNEIAFAGSRFENLDVF